MKGQLYWARSDLDKPQTPHNHSCRLIATKSQPPLQLTGYCAMSWATAYLRRRPTSRQCAPSWCNLCR